MPPASPPPVALTSLKIRDFRGIEHLELDFRGPDGLPNNLVVLAGPNGSGKTAVLEAALIAVGGHKLAVGPRGKRAIRRGAADYLIEADLRARRRSWPRFPTPRRSASRIIHAACRCGISLLGVRQNLVGSVNVTVGKSLAGVQPRRTRYRLSECEATTCERSCRPELSGRQQIISHTILLQVGSLGINEGWKKFYPDCDDRFGVGLAESEEGNGGAFEVFYQPWNSLPLSVDDLSAGQLELFLFLASLAINAKIDGIVFIDEPELHLDPQWHAPIVRALMELQPNAQFIVATHSPEIYDAAMSYERHFLVPEDDPRARAWPGVGASAEA